MTVLDHSNAWHVASCRRCKWHGNVYMRDCSIERMPWRLRWSCVACAKINATVLSVVIAELLIDTYERPAGTRISKRELSEWMIASRSFDDHVRRELLDA